MPRWSRAPATLNQNVYDIRNANDTADREYGDTLPVSKSTTQTVNLIVDNRDEPNGFCGLDADGKVPQSLVNSEYTTPSGQNLTLNPATKRIVLSKFFTFPTTEKMTVTQANADTSKRVGDFAYITQGDGTSDCIAEWDGTNWKIWTTRSNRNIS